MGCIWMALLVRCVHGPGVFEGKGETFGRWGWGRIYFFFCLIFEGLSRSCIYFPQRLQHSSRVWFGRCFDISVHPG